MPLATVAQVVGALDALRIPSTNLKWEDQQAPPPPYAVLVPHQSRNRYKDGAVWSEARAYDVELYTSDRDIPLEKAIARALRDAGVVYSSDVYADESNGYCVAYFSTTLIEQEAD